MEAHHRARIVVTTSISTRRSIKDTATMGRTMLATRASTNQQRNRKTSRSLSRTATSSCSVVISSTHETKTRRATQYRTTCLRSRIPRLQTSGSKSEPETRCSPRFLEANPDDPRFAKEGVWAHVQLSDSVKKTVHNRYLQLASVNFEHFANPRGANSGGPASGNRHSAGGSYRALHEGALDIAHEAKKEGKEVNEAMAHEAAAEHFLTDGFAAGHLRTPRASIKEDWDARYPLFFENLKKSIAQDVSIYMNANETNPATLGGSVLAIEEKILPAIDDATKALPPIGVGDIVSGLEHDVDNADGLMVTNDLGEQWRTLAIATVASSIQSIRSKDRRRCMSNKPFSSALLT